MSAHTKGRSFLKEEPVYQSHIESATLSEISLKPAEHILSALKTDYIEMKNMIYGKYPSFDEILDCLKALETDIHKLGNSANFSALPSTI